MSSFKRLAQPLKKAMAKANEGNLRYFEMVMACSSFLRLLFLCALIGTKVSNLRGFSAGQRTGNELPLNSYAKSKPCWIKPTKLMRAAFKSVWAAMRAKALWEVPASSMLT